jgi:rubrerythrin
MNIRKIFEYALQREHEGKAFFENNAERLQNAAAVGAFKAIAMEEQKHIDFIQHQIDLIDGNQLVHEDAAATLPQTGFFADRAEDIEQTVAESMVADLPVLRMAYLIERDFAEFYAMAAAKLAQSNVEGAQGEPLKILEMLAHWESGHERLFKRLHDQAFEKYAEMPWGG